MFTPHKKNNKQHNFNLPAPPVGLLNDTNKQEQNYTNNNDWLHFKKAGFLNETSMEAKDQAALARKVENLERELADYQYNMGLLLIERKDWLLNYEQLEKALAEVQEVTKHQHEAHLVSYSEAENREGNLRRALGVEKQCVEDLEKALRELQTEYTQLKLKSETKLSDANDMVTGIEVKSVEVEKNLYAANAELAEASRKSSEFERRLQELETRESVLRRERQSINAEREAHEATFRKHKKDLQDWERKLQEAEERLWESRRLINQREEKTNNMEQNFQQKEKDLEELQKRMESNDITLREKEQDIATRLSDLVAKEEKAKSVKSSLELKEKELLSLSEKLTARERIGIQQILDEHRVLLDKRRQELDLELEERKKLFDNELRDKAEAANKKETQLAHMEEKLRKQEQAFEKKSVRLKEKDKDLDTKVKALKEKEKSIKADEERLETEKKLILSDKESIQASKAEIDKVRAGIAQQELQINEEKEKLRISEAEKAEHIRLKSQLKEEIENYRMQNELLLKQGDDLRKESKKFEKEWEALDEKRAAIAQEALKIDKEKEKFEYLRHSEEERLQKEKLATKDHVQRELESAKLEKESFEVMMKHERAALSEKAKSEETQLHHEFELRRQDLEIGIREKQEEMEKVQREKLREFEEERRKELANLNHKRRVIEEEREDLKSEKAALEKEKCEISLNKQYLETQQLDMHTDIEELGVLSKKLKSQREQFMKERGRFLAFIEKLKGCNSCGDNTRQFGLSDLQILDLESSVPLSSPGKLNEILTSSQGSPGGADLLDSEGHMAWIRKCTSIFKSTPSKIVQYENNTPLCARDGDSTGKALFSTVMVNREEPRGQSIAEEGPEPSIGNANDLYDLVPLASSIVIRQVDTEPAPSVNNQSSQVHNAPEGSEQSEQMSQNRRTSRIPKVGVHKTHSMKAVVEDAKDFLGETFESSQLTQPLSNESARVNEKAAGPTPRKRAREDAPRVTESELDADISEGQSESFTSGRRKRRQTVLPTLQTPVGNRYNLRRDRTPSSKAAAQASVDVKKKKDKRTDSQGHDAINVKRSKQKKADDKGHNTVALATNLGVDSLGGSRKIVNGSPLVQVTTSKSSSSHPTGSSGSIQQ